MSDPRNVAHDKTVQLNKKHEGKPIVADAAETPQPGKKPTLKHHARDDKPDPRKPDASKPDGEESAADKPAAP